MTDDLVMHLAIGYLIGQVLVLLLLTAPLWGEWLRDRTRAIAAARRLAARRRHA